MEGSTPKVKGKTEILDSVFGREQKYGPVILLGKKTDENECWGGKSEI